MAFSGFISNYSNNFRELPPNTILFAEYIPNNNDTFGDYLPNSNIK